MKPALVFTLGNRVLFRQLLWSFSGIGAVGILSLLRYYDLGLFS